jgi:hypothetical protein
MNPILTALGIPEEVQSFFGAEQLLFAYGCHYEHYDEGFHRVPTTTHLWTAGSLVTREVIITPTAMEAMAYLTLHRHKYHRLDNITCIAVGNLPHDAQLKWITANFNGKRFTLVFPGDLLGKLADIKIAAAINGVSVAFRHLPACIEIKFKRLVYRFSENELSLNRFEKTTALRTGCRTAKPKFAYTFLEQLKNDAIK